MTKAVPERERERFLEEAHKCIGGFNGSIEIFA